MPRAAAPGGARRPPRLTGTFLAAGIRQRPEGAPPRLMMAIPKKLVPSAPVRNLIRRVIREAHRAAVAASPDAFGRVDLHVQLIALPRDPAAPSSAPAGRPARPFDQRPPDGALKRAVRADADALLARVSARFGRPG
jgi:hypothetical protein